MSDSEAAASTEPVGGAATPASPPSDGADGVETKAPTGNEVRDTNGVATRGPDEDSPARPRLVPRGNPLRWGRGGLTAIAGSIVALVLMGHEGHLPGGVPIGALFVAVASWGVMDLLGTFDDPSTRVSSSTTLATLARPLAVCGLAWVCFLLALAFAAAGGALGGTIVLPQVGCGVLVTVAFIAAVASVYRVGTTLGVWLPEAGARAAEAVDVPFWKRHGFWVVALAAALYFPFMGTSSLWDPWETHYGEVAREMLARDDWISLWWAQDGWFWSKPVLDMWWQALAMATLGVHYQPDKMLIGDGTAPILHPEWAVRAPVVLATILAMYVLYAGLARWIGRRAAFLGSLVLATTPDWYLLTHQTMTDMPFVATMTTSIGFVFLGLDANPDARVRAYEVVALGRRWRLTAWHLVFGAILACALPQILYLVSRNVEFLWRPGARGFHPHWDEFRSGSGMGNCGLPGNEECKPTLPAFIPHATGSNPTTFGASIVRLFGAYEPVVQALVWLACLAAALWLSWGERRVRRLHYLAAWFFAGVSSLGKGPAGFALPMLVTFLFLVASRPDEDIVARLSRVVREITEFEVLAGVLVMLAVALPWYIAMYVRHGPPFTDRLIFHDMFNRAFHHVHDTNEGDDTSFRFYVWQLGYALFPWTALAPTALLWWLRRGDDEASNRRSDASILLCLWFVVGFALFSFMGTKFHHYIFPAVPPVAMLIGVVLDDMLGARPLRDARSLAVYVLGLAASAVLMVWGAALTQPGTVFGTKPLNGPLAPASPVLGAIVFVAGAAVAAAVLFLQRRGASPVAAEAAEADLPSGEAAADRTHGARMLAAGAVAGALLLLIVARDLVYRGESADQPGAIRLRQLYTYNYRRPWPEVLDFSAALVGFSVVATLAFLALAFRSFRRHAVALVSVLAVVWGFWGVDVYMQRTAQHWGQHEIIAAYYADRASPDEMLVAYQMNWKGENFYTGNDIPAFVSTGATFTQWLKKQRDAGKKVLYFITEHGRIGGLKSEVGAKSYREVTDKALNNKFILVRAVL